MSNEKQNETDDTAADAPAPLYHEEYCPPFLPALVILPFLLPAFWKYHVTITKEEEDKQLLSFGYSWATVKVPTVDKLVGEATPLSEVHALTRWGGWGIRKNLRWHTGYIARNGPGVQIQVGSKEKHHTYVFNCKDPEKVCSILNNGQHQ